MLDTIRPMGLDWSMIVKCSCGCGNDLENLDSRGRLRRFIRGHNHNRLGTKHTAETKAKIRVARARQTITEETKRLWSKNRTGSGNPAWKGGRYKLSNGYIALWKPEHPFANKDGYIYEHRFIVEQNIGRYLKKTEVVHHINKVRSDNRINNLQLFASHSKHIKEGHRGV